VWSWCNDSVSEWCMARSIAISTCCGQQPLSMGTCTFPCLPTLATLSSRPSIHRPTPHHHGLTCRRIPCADNSGPIVPSHLVHLRARSGSDAVTCAPCAAIQGLFPRSELADGHLNEWKRVLAASLPTLHSLLVPQSQTAPVQFGILRVPSIR